MNVCFYLRSFFNWLKTPNCVGNSKKFDWSNKKLIRRIKWNARHILFLSQKHFLICHPSQNASSFHLIAKWSISSVFLLNPAEKKKYTAERGQNPLDKINCFINKISYWIQFAVKLSTRRKKSNKKTDFTSAKHGNEWIQCIECSNL